MIPHGCGAFGAHGRRMVAAENRIEPRPRGIGARHGFVRSRLGALRTLARSRGDLIQTRGTGAPAFIGLRVSGIGGLAHFGIIALNRYACKVATLLRR